MLVIMTYLMPEMTPAIIDMLSHCIDKRAPNACWPWVGKQGMHKTGYGRLYINGKSFAAHRLVLHADGRNPDGMHACHRCDNPPCCNPAHLYVGTHADNMEDKMTRGHHKTKQRRLDKVAPALASTGDWLQAKPSKPQGMLPHRAAVRVIDAPVAGSNWHFVPTENGMMLTFTDLPHG